MSVENPQRTADELLTKKDKRDALVRVAQRKDTVARSMRRDGYPEVAVRARRDAFEARKLARSL